MRANHSIKSGKVEELVQKMKSSYSFASVNYSALGTKSSEWLRREVKKNQGSLQMVPNNVLKRALQLFSNTDEKIEISGQNFVLLINSEKIAPLKLISDLVKKYSLLKLGVVFCANNFLLDVQKEYLSSWLEKEVVFSKLAYLLNYPIISLIFTLRAIESKKQ